MRTIAWGACSAMWIAIAGLQASASSGALLIAMDALLAAMCGILFGMSLATDEGKP